MAKGNGIVGLITGKFGNLVGYRNTNSNNRETQAIRAYVAQVANPKSSGQALQRVKLTPAQNFFRAFQDPLDHAFQNVKFGQKNRQRFISLAMSQSSFPGVVKGSRVIPAFPYQISEGSLPIDVNPAPGTNDDRGNVSFMGIALTNSETIPTISSDMSVSAFSTIVLNANPQLSEGDELHFMALVFYPQTGAVVPHQLTLVLNTGDTLTTLQDIYGTAPLMFSAAEPQLTIESTETISEYILYGAGLIVTRRNGSGWIYSSSYFFPTGWGNEAFNTAELRAAAAASYAAGASELTSTRTLQQADNDTIDQGVTPRSLTTATFALTQALTTAGWTAASTTAAVVQMSDGTRKVVVKSDSNHRLAVCRYDEGVGFVTINRTYTSGQTTRTEIIAIEDTNLNGNGYILASEVPFV